MLSGLVPAHNIHVTVLKHPLRLYSEELLAGLLARNSPQSLEKIVIDSSIVGNPVTLSVQQECVSNSLQCGPGTLRPSYVSYPGRHTVPVGASFGVGGS